MENIIKLKSYNLVNADGWRLQLYLGMDVDVNRTYTKGKLDKGFRWSFVGTKIPVPVRAYTWFNGFPESVMLDWLKENGWALHTVVELPDGKATVYELPNADDIPAHTAKEMYDDTIPVAMERCMSDIEAAKDAGLTHCYIGSNLGKIPVEVIKSLMNAGYDITYHSYGKGYGSWYVQAFWHRSCKKGKIFISGVCGAENEVTIDDYRNA